MPMTFDEETLRKYAEMVKLPLEPRGTLRTRAARHSESTDPPDYVQAWEIRTGRPWNEMTRKEAENLLLKRPELILNPGVWSRLTSEQDRP